jgi:hypothetical protein
VTITQKTDKSHYTFQALDFGNSGNRGLNRLRWHW